jgi:hypothetical protein
MAREVDLIFSLLRYSPPKAEDGEARPHWVDGDCTYRKDPVHVDCTLDHEGTEVSPSHATNPDAPSAAQPHSIYLSCLQCRTQSCTSVIGFGGATNGVRVRNRTCGWAPSMRWDRLLATRDVRSLPVVGVQGVVYQLPPPDSMAPLKQV